VVTQPIRSITLSIFTAILCLSLLPSTDAHALMDSSNSASLPTLETFIQQVKSSSTDQLSGIYIPDILAHRVVQQPAGNHEFVSPWENIVTQFDLASRLGSTGLIAHNYLAGKAFALLQPGQEIDLVYGDGHISVYIVSEVLQYQALVAASTSSAFMDITDKSIRTAADLFGEVYNRSGMLVLQTCIAAENNPSWGRLFIIAVPANG
jgi:hypothetical protein